MIKRVMTKFSPPFLLRISPVTAQARTANEASQEMPAGTLAKKIWPSCLRFRNSARILGRNQTAIRSTANTNTLQQAETVEDGEEGVELF